MLSRIFLSIAMALVPIVASAEPAPIYPGEATCRHWTAGKDDVSAANRGGVQDTAYAYWLGGFFDAAAVTRGYKLPDNLDRGALLIDLWKLCKSFPEETLPRAATLILIRPTTTPAAK